jgi:hypothetical protein
MRSVRWGFRRCIRDMAALAIGAATALSVLPPVAGRTTIVIEF